jgi:hypothetical protein
VQGRGAHVGERAVVAAPAVPGEGGEQRDVLARVVEPGGRRVAAVVRRQHQQVALRIEPLEPAPHRRVDALQRAVEPLDVLAVPEELVGLDEVHEHEAVVELADQGVGRGDGVGVARSRVLRVDPHPGEDLADLADRVHGLAGVLQLLEVGARGRVDREVAAVLRALEGPRLADEGPGDHPADGVLAAHDRPRGGARGVELLERHEVLVRGDLQDGVRGRVDDQVARLEVLLAVVGDRLEPVVGRVAQRAATRRLAKRVEDLGREAVGVGPHRLAGSPRP